MLKNKTREQLVNKFNLKKNILLNQAVKENRECDKKEMCDEYIKNKLAIIDVPNYLELPVFKYSKTLLICLFQIVMEGSSPFLLYLLHSEKRGDELNFIQMITFDGGKHNNNLTEEAVDYMKGQLTAHADISYAGFTETPTNNILFLKYISLTDYDKFSLPPDFYWATTHELVNLKTVMNIPVSFNVTQFFINNPLLLQLNDEEEVVYESPVVGYYMCNKDICNKETNDIYREVKFDKYGKCYYFYINMPKRDNFIITRAALFLKHTGLLNDNFDEIDSIVYNNKDSHYYLIKSYAQHTVL